MPSVGFTSWGEAGEGSGSPPTPTAAHVHGRRRLRFDTSGRSKTGSRWQKATARRRLHRRTPRASDRRRPQTAADAPRSSSRPERASRSEITDDAARRAQARGARRGFDACAQVARVAVFGSARTPQDHPRYALGREVGRALGDAGFTVITGGGPGAMEAANRGARRTRARCRSG
jgi:hypothetical protein